MKEKITISLNSEILDKLNKVSNNRSKYIEDLLADKFESFKTAVILNGGSYEDNLVDDKLKCLTKYDGECLLKKQVNMLLSYGYNDIKLIASSLTYEKIINELGYGFVKKLNFVEDENESGSFSSLKNLEIDNDFLLVYGDVYFNYDLNHFCEFHKSHDVNSILSVTSSSDTKKGELVIDGDDVVSFSQNEKLGSLIYTSSIFYFKPSVLNYSGNNIELDLIPKLVDNNLLKTIILNGKRFHIE
ncbi:MAG: nucleotidyltransferase family protein [Candidatus Woesearchaeota archaeon]